ncbi:MAG TPA: DUF4123 domain-containing protein [Bryobacteraceae bacterium]|nr:DUF4123 domain-containing protein [Bryobacteraceae bacterium]
MAHPHLNRIMQLLWPPGTPPWEKVWAILDGARDLRVFGAIQGTSQDNCCLYAGELSPEMRVAAPYLIQLDNADRLTRYIINNGWGNSWGVFFRSTEDLAALRRHFRRFLIAKDYRGRRLVFRYYDPRILRVYLPTCTSNELETVFGRTTRIMMEGDDPGTFLSFQLTNGELLTDSVPLEVPQLAAAPAT